MINATRVVIFENDGTPMNWAVEAYDTDGNGGVDRAVFSGPHAKKLARVYAAAAFRVACDSDTSSR